MQFGGGQTAPIALSYDKQAMLSCLVDDLAGYQVDLLAGTECLGIGPGPAGFVVATSAGQSMCSLRDRGRRHQLAHCPAARLQQ